MKEHPITPPPELVQAFLRSNPHTPPEMTYEQVIATRFARWGADQELQACCEWLKEQRWLFFEALATHLRAARRPKPPSLKEQALEELELLRGDANAHGLGFDAPAIRRALESLPS